MGFAGRVKDHPPLWRQTMRSWSADELEEWEERAAIRTHLGGQSIEEAEKGAWDDVTNHCLSRTRGGT